MERSDLASLKKSVSVTKSKYLSKSAYTKPPRARRGKDYKA